MQTFWLLFHANLLTVSNLSINVFLSNEALRSQKIPLTVGCRSEQQGFENVWVDHAFKTKDEEFWIFLSFNNFAFEFQGTLVRRPSGELAYFGVQGYNNCPSEWCTLFSRPTVWVLRFSV